MATVTLFTNFKKALLDNSLSGAPVDFSVDDIYVMLLNSNNNIDTSKDTVLNAGMEGDEVSGSSYDQGGEWITNANIVTDRDGITSFDGDDVTWLQDSSGFDDARYGLIYKNSGFNSTSVLIGVIDFGEIFDNIEGDLIIRWSSLGILTI